MLGAAEDDMDKPNLLRCAKGRFVTGALKLNNVKF